MLEVNTNKKEGLHNLQKIGTAGISTDINKMFAKLSAQKKQLFLVLAAGMVAISIIIGPEKIYNWVDVEITGGPVYPNEYYYPVWTYAGERNVLEPEATEIAQRINVKYSLDIASPITDVNTKNLNLPWNAKELSIVEDTLDEMPEVIINGPRFPKTLFLNKAPGSESYGAGGGYAKRALFLSVSENFNPDDQFDDPEAKRLYGLQGNHLKMVVIHELFHSFSDQNPELLKRWEQQMGWHEDVFSGNWINDHPEKLPPGMLNPIEDIAESAAFAACNPNILDSVRLDFFKNNPAFSKWFEK